MIGSRDGTHESGSFSMIYEYASGTTSRPSLLFAYPAYRQRDISGRVTLRTDHRAIGDRRRRAYPGRDGCLPCDHLLLPNVDLHRWHS
jgi:hypothetical protein